MPELFQLFLFFHIVTAIVAFGPTFAFPIIARQAAGGPAAGLFALKVTEAIESKLVLPAALTMPVTGLGIVWAAQIDLLAAHWLLLAISVYVVAIAYSVGVQAPTVARMIKLVEGAAPTGALLAAGPGALWPVRRPRWRP
ncbi:MAG: DUF2269 family protein [Candidatus Limnocylindrales bacterium]